MKTTNFQANSGKHHAFTLAELLVVIFAIAVLAALMLPALAQTNKAALRTQCVNNLKSVGLGFKVWEDNHGGKYPMAVSTASGGAMEYIGSASTASGTASGGVTAVFQVMSNELRTPTILYCPSDHSKSGDGTVTNVTMAMNWDDFTNRNLSYFVAGDASDIYPKMVMVGDRNIGSCSGSRTAYAADRMFASSIGNLTAYSQKSGQPWNGSTLPVGTHVKAFPWAWTDIDLHRDVGNVSMADGSVQSLSIAGLQKALNDSTNSAVNSGRFTINVP